jgi:hypothetical protein
MFDEVQENLQTSAVADFLTAYVTIRCEAY